MPTQLYLLAASIEAQMRALVHTDLRCASRLYRSPETPMRSVRHFELVNADTVVVAAVSTEICVAELNAAHRHLTACTERLREALVSRATDPILESLGVEAERLRVLVAAFA